LKRRLEEIDDGISHLIAHAQQCRDCVRLQRLVNEPPPLLGVQVVNHPLTQRPHRFGHLAERRNTNLRWEHNRRAEGVKPARERGRIIVHH
jgi:hypothetical protein|tara:strand:- start:1062 stop:1334 length:273 start_codon:yes stop_codon:yes gene_type:complete